MDQRAQARFVVIAAVVVFSAAVLGIALAGSSAAETADYNVTQDDSGDFSSIQEAVDNASDGETILVEDGTYVEAITINKTITVVANSSNVVLNGSTSSTATHAIEIANEDETDVEPTIDGFSITEYDYGVDARNSTGNWTVQNTTIQNTHVGINGRYSEGQPTVRDTVVQDTGDHGIIIEKSSGSWLIESTTVQDTTRDGIDGFEVEDVVVHNTTISNTGEYGLNLFDSSGDVQVTDTTIYGTDEIGINADKASGSIEIHDTTVQHTGYHGIDIGQSTGEWAITSTTTHNTTGHGIDVLAIPSDGVLQDVEISNAGRNGINVNSAAANWTVDSTSIVNTGGQGIDAHNGSSGYAPVVQNTVVRNASNAAINAWNSESDLEVIDSSATDSLVGVGATETAGAWNVSGSTMANNIVGVMADQTTGEWQVSESELFNNTHALNATDAAIRGDATHNFWDSQDGPSGDFNGTGDPATGNVSISPLYGNFELTELVDEPLLFGDGAIEHDPVRSGTTGGVFDNTRVSAQLPAIRPGDASLLAVNENRSFRITRPATGENVTITPENASTLNASTMDIRVYDPTGELSPQPELTLVDRDDTRTDIDATVTGDEEMFTNDTFASYRIEHLNDTGDVIGDTPEVTYGIGYEGQPTQNATEGTVEVTLDRAETVDESWDVEYEIFNESDTLITETVENTDDKETFTATFDADELDNGTYFHEFEITPADGSEQPVLNVFADDLEIGPGSLVSEPVVNTSASGVTPNTTTVNEAQEYDVDVVIEDTPLTDEEGVVVVTGGEVDDTLAINYTGANISDGTLSVSESATGTAPDEPETIPVNVTDLWVEDTEELLISDANITIDEIEVTEPTIETDASSVTPTSTATEETQSYDVDLTVDNTSLDDDSGEVDVRFDGFEFENDDDEEEFAMESDNGEDEFTISYTEDNVSDGTLSVSETAEATAPDSTGVYNVTVTDLRRATDDTYESLIENETAPFSSISVEPPTTGTLVVNQTDGVGDYNTISDATDNAEDGATVYVEQGTYEESVTIVENISLVTGPDGAVLEGSTVDANHAVLVDGEIDQAVIDGFTITGYNTGIEGGSAADWELRNATIHDVNRGVSAADAQGNWSIENTDISNTVSEGVFLAGSHGNGTIESTTVTNTSTGIGPIDSDGQTVVSNSSVSHTSTGIDISNADGEVTIQNSILRDNDVGVVAADEFSVTTADWTVEESQIQNNTEAINATGAETEGQATQNYWGAEDGPGGAFAGSGDPAVGNLTVDPYYTNESLSTLGTTTELTLAANETDVTAGDPIEFSVTDADGDGVENVTVELSDVANRTDADGTVTLRPETVGSLTARASKDDELTDDALATYISDSQEIRVSDPTLEVVESEHEFGAVDVGTTAQTTVTLRNNASVALAVESVDLDGADAYRLGELPEEIDANTDESVTVTFAPDDIGPAEAELEVDDEVVAFSGTGLAPVPNITSPLPPEVSADHTSSQNTTLEITNDGNEWLNASLSVADDRFTVPDTINISAQSSESVEIEFAPAEVDNGTISPELTIQPEHPALSTVEIPVVGTVTERTVEIRSDEVDFGNTTVGENTTAAVIVDNTGTTTEELSVETDDETNFTIDSEDASFTLEPGESERLTPTANLPEPGTATATLTVQNDSETDISDTATLTATGQEPVLDLQQTDVTFTGTPVNSTSSEEIAIQNTGEAELRVDLDNAFNSTERENFSVGGSTEFAVPGGETRTATVRFRPQAATNVTANLTVETNAGTENVSLDGEGLETNLQITGDIPDFGAVGTDGSSTETLTIENDGGSAIDLSSEISPASEFTVESIPDSLDAGEENTVTVAFSPDAAGDRTGDLEIIGENTTSEDTATVLTSLDGEGRTGELSISRSELRTGVATGGDSTTGSIAVENSEIEDTTLEVDEISIDDDAFSVDSSSLTEGDVLGGAESGDLAVTFSPDEEAEDGEQTADLLLNATSGGETVSESITVTGVVTAPEPVISDDSLEFGTIDAGDENTETLTLSNDGGESFTIEGVTTDEDGIETDDAIENEELVPGAETTFEVTVEREETSTFDGEVTVKTDAEVEEELTTSVSGEAVAPEMSVTTEAVEFDHTSVGSSSTETITIENNGNTSLTVGEPEIADDDHFSVVSGDREQRISAGDSETITVGFAPSDEGETETTLRLVPENDPTDDETREIELNGTGTQAKAVLNESSMSFGDVPQNETANETLEITNDGEAPLEITGSFSITGSDADAFSIDGLDETTLDAGESQTFEVELNATDEDRGSLSAGVEISTDEDDVTSSLGGTVVAPEIDVDSSVDDEAFGTTRLGDTSTARLQVNNTGNTELNVTDLSVGGDDAAAFSVVEAPETIGSQDTERVSVEFDPTAADDATDRSQSTRMDAEATLEIDSDDPDEATTTVGLTGEAETAALDVTGSVRFGTTAVGETTTEEVEIENRPSATAPLNVTALSISGEDDGDYSAALRDEDAPVTLAAGESTTVELNLTPSSADQKYATLAVETNDTRQPVERIGVSNGETVFSVEYGSVNVAYSEPSEESREPTADVDRGLRDRNATLTSVNSDVRSDEDYGLSYEFAANSSNVGYESLTNDSVENSSAVAFQYMNATTDANEAAFESSTFQMEVSKAVLAAHDVEPDEVVIYHENESVESGYDRLETELLFETTQGYVYETITEEYSVFAVGAPQTTPEETGDDDDNGDNGDDDSEETDDDDTTTTTTSSTDDSEEPETDDETTLEDIIEQVEDEPPVTETQLDIDDTEPDQAGVTVINEEEGTVGSITFADETVDGTVDISEYEPDAELSEQLSTSVSADLGSDTDGASGTDVSVVSLTDISPSSEAGTNSAATVEFSVERDTLANPDNAFVVHETDDGWERLETSVEDTDETVTLTAETDSFSLFAVAETRETEPETGDEPETADNETETADDGASPVGLGVGLLVALVVAGGVLALRRYRA